MAVPGADPPAGILPRPLRTAAMIVIGWTLVALAWTPPTILIQTAAQGGSLAGSASGHPLAAPRVFLYLLAAFVPWMAVTPLLLRSGRRYPLSGDGVLRALAVHIAVGVVVVPAVTLAGTLLAVITSQHGQLEAGDLRRVLSASTITAFYTVPTYVAVVAIGQALGYFQHYRRRERLLARAQLRALQAQINPHFLFNTLNAISALGYRDPARADSAISRLAELMRDSLHERPEVAALKDEVAFVRGYLDLYTLLLGNSLQASFDIAGPAWAAFVPSMLLQPLVENAIVHGISLCPEGGRIAVRAYIAHARLAISISNDVPAGRRSTPGNGVGLANVRERLRALYGERHLLEVRQGEGSFTVDISIPFRSEPA